MLRQVSGRFDSSIPPKESPFSPWLITPFAKLFTLNMNTLPGALETKSVPFEICLTPSLWRNRRPTTDD